MKPALFLILFSAILFFNPARLDARTQNVTISMTVDQYLTYSRNDNGMFISTNSVAEYLVLSSAGELIGQIDGPARDANISLSDQAFILVAKF